MNDTDLYIRCPTCRTVFRTRDSMLQMQSGKVRCGQCRMVFDGRSNLVEVAFDDGFADDPLLASEDAADVAAAEPAVAPGLVSAVPDFEDEAPSTITAIGSPSMRTPGTSRSRSPLPPMRRPKTPQRPAIRSHRPLRHVRRIPRSGWTIRSASRRYLR